MQSFSDFKIKLNSLPKISLRLSKTVIAKRDFLKDKFQILENKYRTVKNKFEELKNLNKKIIELKQDINESKNFKKKIKQPMIQKINLNPNNYLALTCMNCTKTCYTEKNTIDVDEKKNCAAFDKKGNCIYCPRRCSYQLS